MTITSLSRNFNSDYLSCDCGLRWVPGFFRNSARLGDETLCAYPRSLRGKPLRGLRESQLSCGESLARMRHMNEAVHHFVAENIGLWWVTITVHSWQCSKSSPLFLRISKPKGWEEIYPSSSAGTHFWKYQWAVLTANPMGCINELLLPASKNCRLAMAPVETFCWGWVMRENDVWRSLLHFFPTMLLRWSSGAAHSVAAAVPASGGLQRRPAALPLHCRPGGQDDHLTLASQWSAGDLRPRDGCPAGEQCAAWLHLHHQVRKLKMLSIYRFVWVFLSKDNIEWINNKLK